ncbi:MAG: helix-turn-helix transcriptional regulator [Eubacterium sp.]|nr:helix-turn-helix transcriptional regulator [Eubacterium sp.]
MSRDYDKKAYTEVILINEYRLFRAEISRVKKLRGLTNKDLANMTGYKQSTIEAFMLNRPGRNASDNVARALSKALNIDI